MLKNTLPLFAIFFLACAEPPVDTIGAALAENPLELPELVEDPYTFYVDQDIDDRELDADCANKSGPDEFCDVIIPAARATKAALNDHCTTGGGATPCTEWDHNGVESTPFIVGGGKTPNGSCGFWISMWWGQIHALFFDYGCDGGGVFLDFVGASICDFVPCCVPNPNHQCG
jgi:hypothetical protein